MPVSRFSGIRPVADAHLQVGADGTARQDGGLFGLNGPNFNVGIFFAQHLPHAGDGAAGADARAKAVDGGADLFKDFASRSVAVGFRVVGVDKLLRDVDVWVFGRAALCHFQTLCDTLSNITVIMHQDHLGAVLRNQLAPLFTHRVGHDNLDPVSTDGAHL